MPFTPRHPEMGDVPRRCARPTAFDGEAELDVTPPPTLDEHGSMKSARSSSRRKAAETRHEKREGRHERRGKSEIGASRRRSGSEQGAMLQKQLYAIFTKPVDGWVRFSRTIEEHLNFRSAWSARA
jgi:hypothetical protein